MLVSWVVVVTAFVLVMVYRGHLTQHETDQLFLSGNNTSVQTEHDDIVRRVNSIQPICQGLGALTVLLTLGIAGMYIAQLVPYMHA